MRVLVWNLFHGRADPPAGRPLLHEFAAAIASWPWDVALLQEVPPWWPPLLASRCRADVRTALTSRNQLLPLRRAVASRRPDLLRSNGGGANAILVREPWSIAAHGRRRLRIRPERRVLHAVRIEHAERARGTGRDAGALPPERAADRDFDGAWVGNVHAQLGSWDGDDGLAAPLADLYRTTAQLEAWARADAPATAPLVLGGDLNLPRRVVVANLPGGWAPIASSGPDHLVGVGATAASPSERPDRGLLSDHAPLLVDLTADR